MPGLDPSFDAFAQPAQRGAPAGRRAPAGVAATIAARAWPLRSGSGDAGLAARSVSSERERRGAAASRRSSWAARCRAYRCREQEQLGVLRRGEQLAARGRPGERRRAAAAPFQGDVRR